MKGDLIISRKKAKIVIAWKKIEEALEKSTVLEGTINRRIKGGLIVDLMGIEAFLPGSQIDTKPIRDFDVFIGKTMKLKVVNINPINDNVIVSHKALIEKDLEKQKHAILSNLERGQVLEGVIKNMTKFGVFVDLGGIDGLLHITDISWKRISHPEEILQLDQKINIVVLDFDNEKKRISLGMKQLTPHPWESLDKDLDIGSIIKGKVVNITNYGIFIEIQPGIEGLIHISEISWSLNSINPKEFKKIGDEIEAKILSIEREDKKMSLGIKQLSEEPWTKENFEETYKIGNIHKGIIRNITDFGVFVELEEGVNGLLHISDISWTKKIKDISSIMKLNEEIEVKVLSVDKANKKLSLGHKQLEENPWETLEKVFEVDSIHKCTILAKMAKGYKLELPYGIEGFCNNRSIKKKDDSIPDIGDSLNFKVVDFSKERKNVILSCIED